MDRKTIIALGLVVLIILVVPYYYKLVLPPPKTPPPTTSTSSDTLRQPAPPAPIPADTTTLSTATPDTAVITSPTEFFLETNPSTVVVETPLYRMEFSTRGAVLTGCRLKKYQGQVEGNVELIRSQAAENLNLLLNRNGNPLDLQGISFKPDRASLQLSEGEQGSITFLAQNGNNRVEKTYFFTGNSYKMDLRLRAEGLPDLDPYYELHWGSGLALMEADTSQDLYYSEAYAFMGGELEKFSAKGDKDLQGGADGETQWVAQRRKYFEVAILPVSRPASGVRFGITAQPQRGKHRDKVYSMALRMQGSLSEQVGSFTVYCGPLDRKLIADVHPQLEMTMNWGWKVIEPFSKLILWTLKGLHSFIPNYGLVLIVFSILIKIIVWPLTYKSTRSMSRMQALQPKLKELQAKFKGQPDKLNRATMQLYKDEKVNPFSGCWPTLLQMPLLYALFIVFRSTIELRGQPFMLWINDLSMPDVVAQLPFSIPLYGSSVAVMPILMGITQFFMSKIMITDPKQKFNVYFMSIFMILIFNGFPSGLTLYYTLFNVWTYVQQVMIQKQGLPESAAPSRL